MQISDLVSVVISEKISEKIDEVNREDSVRMTHVLAVIVGRLEFTIEEMLKDVDVATAQQILDYWNDY